MCNIILPLEIREHILKFTGNNFSTVVKGILGGTDIYNNYYSILERLVCKRKLIGNNFSAKTRFTFELPDGSLHSSKQPSLVVKNKDGMKIKEEWYLFGKLGNLNRDHVSSTLYYDDGTVEVEKWCHKNNTHRDNNLPAYIEYDSDGEMCTEKWMIDGITKRTNVGCIYRVYYNRMISHETYQISIQQDEKYSVNYSNNGNKIIEWWRKDTKMHRDNDLPACRKYFPDGRIKEDVWYCDGIIIKSIVY